ncbi:MAG: hydantoinase B/oxoprolinase family protein, partial [Candidatus Rokubacteria bacterium]|nr:hydantoinase B/oxoprolinase family protein [Candidatus Rokubacteria bacterium]
MLAALATIIPDRVSGDLCGTSFPNAIGGYSRRRGRPYVYVEVPAGGNGGFVEDDGSSAFVNVDFGNIRSIHNAESLENEMPLLVERSRLLPDTGGEGQTRGGLGMSREVRLLDGDARYSVLADRAVIPPFGVGGAHAAAPVHVAIVRDGATHAFATPGKVTNHPIVAGDVVVMQSAGGGGYGDPLARDPERVRADVALGYVSAARAHDRYGVALRDDGSVDAMATRSLRARLAAARRHAPVIADERDPYRGAKGRHRVVRMAPALAAALGLAGGELVELHGRHPAPLRGWVSAEPDASGEAIALDGFGRAMLGVAVGDRVEIRRLEMPRVPGGMAD